METVRGEDIRILGYRDAEIQGYWDTRDVRPRMSFFGTAPDSLSNTITKIYGLITLRLAPRKEFCQFQVAFCLDSCFLN